MTEPSEVLLDSAAGSSNFYQGFCNFSLFLLSSFYPSEFKYKVQESLRLLAFRNKELLKNLKRIYLKLELIENMVSGQTQYDCLSEHLISLTAKSPLSHLMLRKSPDSFFSLWMLSCSPQFMQHPQSYCASLYH